MLPVLMYVILIRDRRDLTLHAMSDEVATVR